MSITTYTKTQKENYSLCAEWIERHATNTFRFRDVSDDTVYLECGGSFSYSDYMDYVADENKRGFVINYGYVGDNRQANNEFQAINAYLFGSLSVGTKEKVSARLERWGYNIQ